MIGTRAVRRATLVVAAVLTMLSIGGYAWRWLAGPDTAAGAEATLDGLTVTVFSAGWVEMGHVTTGPGFTMPDQMMPGAPSGDEVRLGIGITLSNTDSRTRGFNVPEEFALVGGELREPLPMSADTIGTLPRLAPGASVRGVLYFDLAVPADDDPPLRLQWVRGGDAVRIPVPVPNEAPSHGHG
ncbi:MAG TPA: hypothetical protein VK028_14495 [Micromonosporaceae bacterium]|nr:hypothetical protein [Micromonosporaceae bacterium]